MVQRRIVEIDESKCDGCGRCVPACAEGAIRIIDGKAKLTADIYCDGLGACLGTCPRGAITITEREADPFDEIAVQERHKAAAIANAQPAACTKCPGVAVHDIRLKTLPAVGDLYQPSPKLADDVETPGLSHWPIQLHLVPPNAPFLHNADLFLVADCVPFACADFHKEILRCRPVVIGCPKLDNAQRYVEKLCEIFVQSALRSLSVVHMEVPCCTNLLRIARQAILQAGLDIPLTEITITINGAILNK